jgi:SsrA-binding protein
MAIKRIVRRIAPLWSVPMIDVRRRGTGSVTVVAGKLSPPMAKPADDGNRVVASNRQARRDYEILDSFEAGIVLRGSEVKSLREAKVQLADSFARIEDAEVWLYGLNIAAYSHSGRFDGHEGARKRKLLLHRTEIDRLKHRFDQEHLALVPLSLYFKDGRAKIEVGVGRGRKHQDKRQLIAKRDADLEARKAMARRAKGRE